MGICKHCGMYMKPFGNKCEFCGEIWNVSPPVEHQQSLTPSPHND